MQAMPEGLWCTQHATHTSNSQYQQSIPNNQYQQSIPIVNTQQPIPTVDTNSQNPTCNAHNQPQKHTNPATCAAPGSRQPQMHHPWHQSWRSDASRGGVLRRQGNKGVHAGAADSAGAGVLPEGVYACFQAARACVCTCMCA